MKLRIEKSISFWLLILFVPIESISGLMANFGDSTVNIIGYAYRAFVIIYFGKRCLKYRYIKYLLVTLIVICGVLINSFCQYNTNFGQDILVFIRLMYFESLCLGLADLVLVGKMNKVKLERILNISTKFIILIYILSFILGAGMTTYNSGNAGYKAFFNSINSLTLVLIVLSSFQLYYYFRHKEKIHLLYYIILTLFIFLLGSKSGMFFWLVYLLYIMMPRFDSNYIKKVFPLIVLIPIILLIIFIKFQNQLSRIFIRFSYFYTTSDSVIEFIVSGRNNLLSAGWTGYRNNINIFEIIWGKGTYNMQIIIGQLSRWNIIKNIEMDVFDVFFGYGIAGLFITYILCLDLYSKNKSRKLSEEKVIFIICILFSVLGGHVFFDSFGSTIISLVLSWNLVSINNRRNNNEETCNITFR